MEDALILIFGIFIIVTLREGIKYLNIPGYRWKRGLSTRKGRINFLVTILFITGAFAVLVLLYDAFTEKDIGVFLIALILIAVLYGTTKKFPNYFSTTDTDIYNAKKEKEREEKERESNIATENVNNLTKLYDDGKISKRRLLDSIKRLKRKEERSK